MLKNILKRVTAFAIALLTVVPLSMNASDLPEIVIPEVDIDGAPVVIIEDISELPESMKRNIEIVTSKPVDAANCPQERDYYSGYASIQCLLNYNGIYKTQDEIAEEVYSKDDALAWFTGAQRHAADWEYYPAAVYLSSVLGRDYRPYNSYFGEYTQEVLSEILREKMSNSYREPILVCGISSGNAESVSHLPGYPETTFGHWIVIYKIEWDFENGTTEVAYLDPAKSDAVSWSGNIEAAETVSLEKMFAFSSGHGIIY